MPRWCSTGSTDTAAFESYVEQVLVPELHAGDVVVWDNLSPHQAYAAAAAVSGRVPGSYPCRPTAPDYTPIRETLVEGQGVPPPGREQNKDAVYDARESRWEKVTPRTSTAGSKLAELCATHG